MRLKRKARSVCDLMPIAIHFYSRGFAADWHDIEQAYHNLYERDQAASWVVPPLYGEECLDEQSAWDYTIRGILEQMEEVT
jgi:hypothetical protein